MKSKLLVWGCCVLIAVSCKEAELAITAEQQMAIDVGLIDGYLADNGITAQKHPSGLRFVVHQPGSGERPGPDKCVRVNYTVWYLGETTPLEQGSDYATALAQGASLLGWRIGLKEVQKGGRITLYVPSEQAYGPGGAKIGDTTVPKNQVLVFEVEVLNITGYNAAAGYCYPWPS